MLAITEDSPFIRIGGDAKLKKIVDRIFELLDNLPEVWEFRQSFEDDLQISQNIALQILARTFDAPSANNFEHDNHVLPLPLSERQLAQWHLCLQLALNELDVVEDLQATIIDTLSCCLLPRATQVA